ncbi:MAG: DUF4038 domain-containing protein [Bacteroidales bacterium]|nr:DUF4038 domain-containing protein [Bacteroidales bacterium]
MKKIAQLLFILTVSWTLIQAQTQDAKMWQKYELTFTSSTVYENPVQQVRSFEITFYSPGGMEKTINGFWDGGATWRARFMPDEPGKWVYETRCSDAKNQGLNGQKGFFNCVSNERQEAIYMHGPVTNPNGTYHLAHADGTPFFWLACTAWNGALKSTDDEWDHYLKQRVDNSYNVIQLVTTQWRGCDKSSEGLVAFTGCGRISINPEFFRLIDQKIDRVNDYGLVAAPVVLWTLQSGSGRELSPGYYLPDDQAILLAKYIVARYGANHVVWFLGGDGNYTGNYEQRWKTIGRAVFDGKHQGLVAQHPQGRSWIGEIYRDEPWLDIIGYQSSHSNAEGTVNWITKGPMSKMWDKLPARPLINLEPNYEQIGFRITEKDVRNAAWWSLFATPIAGISYGANGIWPWLREGEIILNHNPAPGTSLWNESIEFPGSIQMGYLAQFIRKFMWWNFYPAQELLVDQPGDEKFNHFVSLVKSSDNRFILAYIPVKHTIKLRKPYGHNYTVRWFDPVNNTYSAGTATVDGTIMTITSPSDGDMVMILEEQSDVNLKPRDRRIVIRGKS